MGAIAAKEFTILQKACKVGVPAPTPAGRVGNMFTMRFISDGPMAPSLKDVKLDQPEDTAKQAPDLVEELLMAFIVHGDLSKYNVRCRG